MGERWHLVRGYGFDALCGAPWRSTDKMTMERRVVSCPRCLTVAQLKRPTVLTMDGETGEEMRCGWPVLVADHQGRIDTEHDAIVFDTVWVEVEREPDPDPDDLSHLATAEPLPGCPAPTPRAKP